MGAGSHALATARKIVTLTLLLSVVVYLLASYAESLFTGKTASTSTATGSTAQQVATSAQDANARNFSVVGQANLSFIGVALGNGIATSWKTRTTVPVNLAGRALELSDAFARKNLAAQDFIEQNMQAIQEYANVLSVNVTGLLASSADRAAVLDTYIDQLKYRYTTTVDQLARLNAQITGAQAQLSQYQSDMDALKSQIAGAYNRFDPKATQSYLQNYLQKQEDYIYSRSYLVFTQKFVRSYERLNSFNKNLLDTLINNRDALAKNATVVIPDTGAGLLKSLDLLETEADYKNQ